jgi:hypothetical protein
LFWLIFYVLLPRHFVQVRKMSQQHLPNKWAPPWLIHVTPLVLEGNHFGVFDVTNRKASSEPSLRMAAINPLVVAFRALGWWSIQ